MLIIKSSINLSKFKSLTLSFFISLWLFSCEESPPKAYFSFEVAGDAPTVVYFNNGTINGQKFHWDLGNGIQDVSSSRNDSIWQHYERPGAYTTTLRATNKDGTSKISKTITIEGMTVVINNNGNEEYLDVLAFSKLFEDYFVKRTFYEKLSWVLFEVELKTNFTFHFTNQKIDFYEKD